jgi:hypothetical protein
MKKLCSKLVAFITIFLVTFISCGGAGSDGLDESSTTIFFKFRGAPQDEPGERPSSKKLTDQISTRQNSNIATLQITIKGEGYSIEEVLSVNELPFQAQFLVPLGEATIMVVARDVNEQPVCSGTTNVVVGSGQNGVTVFCFSEIRRCNDGTDNDGDGLIDCEDPDCEGLSCNIENDAFICLNAECVLPTPTPTPTPTPIPTPPPAEDCNDGIDNDGDSFIDCSDADCSTNPDCTETGVPECSDTEDNDGDDLVDCADPDCKGVDVGDGKVCQIPEESCADFFDNDGDALADCADPDCEGVFVGEGQVCEIPEETCNDEFDNDGDGLADCADPDCDEKRCSLSDGTPSRCGIDICLPLCRNGIDDDGDGFTDCEDPDCIDEPFCQ